MKKSAFWPFLLPFLFLLIGLICLIYLQEGLTVDGYFLINGVRELLTTGAYTSYSAGIWPPVYPILVACMGLFLNIEFGAKLLSLLAGTGFLCLLPFLSNKLHGEIWSGIVIQLLLTISPEFMKASLEAETHMLDAFFFMGAVIAGVEVLRKDEYKSLPWKFIVLSLLALLTRYGSFVLIPTFLFTVMFYSSFSKKILYIFNTSGLIAGIFCLWPLYNYLINGYFLSGEKDAAALIGFGMAENHVVKENPLQWVHLGYFKYESLFDLLSFYPFQYLTHVFLNINQVIELSVYKFPPLGIFSIFIGIGALYLFFQGGTPEESFIFYLIFFYFTLIVLLRFDWIYFVHLGGIISVIGLGYSSYKLLNVTGDFSTNTLKYIFIGIVALSIFSFKAFVDCKQYKLTIKNQFRHEYVPSKEVEVSIRNLKERLQNLNITLLTSFIYLPNLYDLGFKLTVAPFPQNSGESFFCYEGLNDQEVEFYRNINFPPGLKKKDYVPPDYFILDIIINTNLKHSKDIGFSDLTPYIERVDLPNETKFVRIYKVKTEKLNCE